jgi:hypothetical protein
MNSKNIFAFLFLFLFLVSFASAAQFDNKKINTPWEKNGADFDLPGKRIGYNNLWDKYHPIDIENNFGLGKKLWSGAITEHTEVCEDDYCYSIFEAYTSGDDPMIDDITFKTEQDDGSWKEQDVRRYTLEYWGDIDDFEYQCSPTKETTVNGTAIQSCGNVKTGTHKGYKTLALGEVLSEGNYKIKLEAWKKPSRTVDWVITTNGRTINEWAVWGGSDMTTDLVAHYKMNDDYYNNTGNVIDSTGINSGTGYGRTINPGTVSGGVSIEDGAMAFDGVDDYVNIGAVQDGLTQLTECGWIYMPTNTRLDSSVGFINTLGGQSRLNLYVKETGHLAYQLRNETSSTTGETMGSFNLDTWQHLCGVYDGTYIKGYINGINIYDKTSETITGVTFGSHSVYIGRDNWNPTPNKFNGSIDDVQIYDRALSEDEISAQYALGRGNYALRNDGLVAQYSGRDIEGTLATPTAILDTNFKTEGKINEAIGFDGVDDYVEIGDLGIGSQSQSVSMWIKSNTLGYLPTDGFKILNLEYTYISLRNENVRFGTEHNEFSSFDLSNNILEWNHISGVYNGTHTLLYVNGELKDFDEYSLELSSGDDWLIGATPAFSNYFNGSIDDVRIYNRSLTTDEIAYIYNEGAGTENDVAGVIDLNYPTNGSTVYNNPVEFNATATVTGRATLVNMSLWNNDGGWSLKNSIIAEGDYIFGFEDGASYTWVSTQMKAPTGWDLTYDSKHYSGAGSKTDEKVSGTYSYFINGGGAGGNDDWRMLTKEFNNTYGSNFSFYTKEQNIGNWFIEVRYYKDTNLLQTDTITQTASFSKYENKTPYGTDKIEIYWESTNDALGSGVYIDDLQLDNVTSSAQTFNYTIPTGNTIWNVQACDSDGDCGFATSNYTVSLDSTAPNVEILYPIGTISTLTDGQNVSLNYTITDTNIDSCWYEYNGTNVTTPCSLNSSFIYVAGKNNITVWANDTIGNTNSKTASWLLNIFINSVTYDNSTIEGSLESFIMNIDTGVDIVTGYLNYNGTNYASSILSLGSGLFNVTNTFAIPDFPSDSNVSFYFNITDSTGVSYQSLTYVQEVLASYIDNCSVYTNKLFNLSLYDERTLADINGTIQIDLSFLNQDASSQLVNITSLSSNVHNSQICSNINFTGTNFLYDLVIRYFSSTTNGTTYDYAPEFYHVQQGTTANLPLDISLYDLNTNESTTFTLKYRDDNYVARDGVLIQLLRNYVNEGIYRVVEIPITSDEGSAIVHLDLNNYKYKAIVTLNGEVLNTFDNLNVECESQLTGLCTINLNGQSSPDQIRPITDVEGIEYTVTQNGTQFTVLYTIPSGETKTVGVSMVQNSLFADPNTLCNTTLTSSSGSFVCDANATIGDSDVVISLSFDDTRRLLRGYVQEDLANTFLLNNYGIAALFVILLVTMMVSSPKIMVSTAVFSVAMLGLMFLLKGSSIGILLGAISWLIITGIIILVKINKKDES